MYFDASYRLALIDSWFLLDNFCLANDNDLKFENQTTSSKSLPIIAKNADFSNLRTLFLIFFT